MATSSQRPKERDGVVSALNVFIEASNLAKEISSITPAKAVFGSVAIILTMIKETLANQQDYVELGMNCGDICDVLDRGTKERGMEHLSQSVRKAISQLASTVAEIEGNVTKQSKRNQVSRLIHAKNDKEKIAAWRGELNRILQIFNTELTIDTNATVSETHNFVTDIHRAIVTQRQGSDGRNPPTHTSVHGESPPQPPRACFGRDDLIKKVVGLTENLEPVALIGAGGIGKTSLALAVLHNDRVKERFGDNRRFIRCDKFPASLPHLLSRLSEVIGAGIDNPEDLTLLQPFLSSRKMILFLDNAESILDPQGADARRIYTTVEELSRFSNICLGITSRITTVPPHFERPTISTLSMESACDIFYSIYDDGGRSEVISDLVTQLDCHALSITLLATTASHNAWDHNRLAKEWDTQRAQVLRTDYNESLAATIELSLASPTFRNIGTYARDLLGVVAFYPQGIDENNLDWLFPTIPNRRTIFDKFCLLSLTSRSDNFITMLAPIRDHLRPQDPNSSPLLCATKDHYFTRLSVKVDPDEPAFKDARWIVSEDANVEYLLDVFTSIDMNSATVWNACTGFMRHMRWFKPRYTVLGPKVEGLADDHRSKLACLIQLSLLSYPVGNYTEQKRLLDRALKLAREQEDVSAVADTLTYLSGANRELGLHKEGIQQAKEALGIYERFGDPVDQAECLDELARLLHFDGQINEAEEAASRAVDLLPEKGQEFRVCQCHRSLGNVYQAKREREKAIHHFEKALAIASRFESHGELFWIHYALADLFLNEDGFDDAHSHVDQAKSHADDNTYYLGRAMEMKAQILYRQRRFEDAVSETLGALESYEKIGASKDIVDGKNLLRDIEQAIAAHALGKGKKSFFHLPKVFHKERQKKKRKCTAAPPRVPLLVTERVPALRYLIPETVAFNKILNCTGDLRDLSIFLCFAAPQVSVDLYPV